MKITLHIFLFSLLHCSAFCKIRLERNGYEGVIIAIHPEITQSQGLLQKIKDLWTKSSDTLFKATKRRAYFKNITILLPESWTTGNYSESTGETYSAADVLVANPNPVFWNIPYTLQYGGCGQPGQYIHVTPDYHLYDKYIFDSGPKDKVIVHEWAHLRWGVFDEGQTLGTAAFYLTKGSVQATRCPKSLSGFNFVVNEGSISPCSQNKNTLLPEQGCQFIAKKHQRQDLNTSLMSHQYIEGVSTFCHSDSSDPVNMHNTDAPNEQNRLCNLRSTWDVILDSDDFKNGMNPENLEITETAPTFRIVRASSPRFVLVMDVSGSMNGHRLLLMRQAAYLFVSNFAPDNSFIGLVEFNSDARILSDLIKVDNNTRGELASKIPKVAGGSTGIGAGIIEGINVLKVNGQLGGNMILLTDGEETYPPYVTEVYNEVIDNRIKLLTIFMDLTQNNVNKILTNLSEESGGKWFVADSSSTSNDILEIFQSISQTDNGDKLSKSLQIHSHVASSVEPSKSYNGSVIIDSTIGNSTVFAFGWQENGNPPKITIQKPSSNCFYASYIDPNIRYCPDQPIHYYQTDIKTIKFEIPFRAEQGTWKYIITNDPINQATDYTITVVSSASDPNVNPIEIETTIGVTAITSVVPTSVYVKVVQGYAPVLNANVIAVISPPNGQRITSDLYDNGAGADIRKNDGVYSRYFTQFNEEGRYSIKVKVERGEFNSTKASGSPAAFNPGVIDEIGQFEANPNGFSNTPNISTTPEQASNDTFERVQSGGGFSYSGPTITGDLFPPNAVIDLSIRQHNLSDPASGITLTFTAPGDDLDTGNASRYEIRYTFGNASTLVQNFNESEVVDKDKVTEGNLDSPKPALQQETITFSLSHIPSNQGTVQIAVALRAYDEAKNPSPTSNVAVMTFFMDRNALPVIETGKEATTVHTDDHTDTNNTDKEATTIHTDDYTDTDNTKAYETTTDGEDNTDEQPKYVLPPPDNLIIYQILLGVFATTTLILACVVIVFAKQMSTNAIKERNKFTSENPYPKTNGIESVYVNDIPRAVPSNIRA